MAKTARLAKPAHSQGSARSAVVPIRKGVKSRGSAAAAAPEYIEPAYQRASLVRIDAEGYPWVQTSRTPRACLRAQATLVLTPGDLGAELLLVGEPSSPELPVVIGKIEMPSPAGRRTVQATLDGDEVELRASKEVVLCCGAASIRLTRNGKVVIKGEAIVSKARKANRIIGGTVELN